MKTKALKGLYGISNQKMLLDSRQMLRQVEQALKGGMAVFQYRNKHKPRIQTRTDLIQLKALCHRYNAVLIINDDIALCADIQADGVHLGKDDDALEQAKLRLPKSAIIGISCYNQIGLAQQAVKSGASYIALGAFYASPTKPDAPTATLEIIQQALELETPICCIGGINIGNAPPLIQHGGDMIAVISALFNSQNIQSNAEKLSQLF